MNGQNSILFYLRDPTLASHAISALPVWLFTSDGGTLLFANPNGAAIFDFESSAKAAGQKVETEIAVLAAQLPFAGPPRLERLRKFGAELGRPLLCQCSRIAAGDGTAILIVATEPAGPNFTQAEQLRRLLDGGDDVVAAFANDGSLVHASPAALSQLSGRTSVADLGDDIDAREIGDEDLSVVLVKLPAGAAPTIDIAPIAEAMARIATEAERAEPDSAKVKPSPEHDLPALSEKLPRRHPLRFVWEMDTEGRFTIGTQDFIDVAGTRTASLLGRHWPEIANELALDPGGQVIKAVASRDTWSGIAVVWPVQDGADRIRVELAGLPVFDGTREFRGYRGFGVCRETTQNLTSQAQATPETTPAADQTAVQPQPERPVLSVVPQAENVVPFRAAASDNKNASLSSTERTAFRDLATRLTARLKGADELARGDIVHDSDDVLTANFPVADRTGAGPVAAGLAQQPRPVPDVAADTSLDEWPVLERLPVGLLIYRHDQFIHANRAFLDLTGHASLGDFAHAGGLDSLFIEPVTADNDTDSGQPVRIVIAEGQPPLDGRLIDAPWDDGTAMVLMLSPARYAAPQPIADHAAIAEAARQREADEARWKISERDLIAARQQAEKASSAKSEFLAKISHEMRTPLNAIIGFSQVMMDERFGAIGNDRYRDYLKDIHVSGVHLVALLNDLLDLSNIEAGKLDLTFERLDLNDLTQQTVAIMQVQANQARVIVRTALTGTVPDILADARSVRQIVLNLLSNSIKFTPPGGQVIVSTAANDEGDAILRVRDTGVGMSEKDIQTALEPFRQLATAPRKEETGTGLGLPLTKALAEANKARFSIKSAVNAGTLVEITFPPRADRS